MGMRRALGFVACSLMLSACQSAEHVRSSGDDGNCISHYEEVAQASVRSLVTLENKPDGKRVVNLLNAKRRMVMPVEVWCKTGPANSFSQRLALAMSWLQFGRLLPGRTS
jgi:hypothetical protein